VLAEDEGSDREADEEGRQDQEQGGHGYSFERSSTRTRGPRSAGLCGVEKE
jgi:hypothetical protein